VLLNKNIILFIKSHYKVTVIIYIKIARSNGAVVSFLYRCINAFICWLQI